MRILVAGDVVIDHYIYEGAPLHAGSMRREGARCISEVGGAGLTARLLHAVATLSPNGNVEPAAPRFQVGLGSPVAFDGREAFCVMQRYAREHASKDHVWRVARALGYSTHRAGSSRLEDATPESDAPGASAAPLDESREAAHVGAAARTVSNLHQSADVVVLDDAGLEFRRWPSRGAWPAFLYQTGRALPHWIVLKMSGPVAAGDLWHTIVSEHTQPDGEAGKAQPDYLGPLRERTIVLLSADKLRQQSARVDGWLSWERAAADLIDDLERNQRLSALKRIPFLVVRFGLDGALVVDRSGAEPTRTLIFDPSGIEGGFLPRVPGGALFGYQSCLTAAVAARLAEPAAPADAAACRARLIDGIQAGLRALRELAMVGHNPDPQASPPASFPHRQMAGVIAGPALAPRSFPPFAAVTLPPALPRNGNWTIIGRGERESSPFWGLARRVATRGVGQLAGLPYVQFAKLFSVDRSEIEGLRVLQRLLASYKEDVRATKPLSIAAFGPPGSGKSFGVKQLADALFNDRNPLEFNLAQFSSPAELHGLFHQVRDRVLQGAMPIVFWDEFDSRDSYWLQYLLAPMQDGTFQDGQVTHPIGKCVFVFAGGTRHRFEDFGWPPAPLAQDEREAQRWQDDFTKKKGPDFKSRLAGYLNVLGPNPRDDDDVTFPVRRALLLRIHLGLAPEATATIDPRLLNAFLRVSTYRHGARSLERLASQVRLSARSGAFNPSDLPPRPVLDLHVAAEEFLSFVEHG